MGWGHLIPPLLAEAVLGRLTSSYMDMGDNYTNLMTNTIRQEKEDQCSDIEVSLFHTYIIYHLETID